MTNLQPINTANDRLRRVATDDEEGKPFYLPEVRGDGTGAGESAGCA